MPSTSVSYGQSLQTVLGILQARSRGRLQRDHATDDGDPAAQRRRNELMTIERMARSASASRSPPAAARRSPRKRRRRGAATFASAPDGPTASTRAGIVDVTRRQRRTRVLICRRPSTDVIEHTGWAPGSGSSQVTRPASASRWAPARRPHRPDRTVYTSRGPRPAHAERCYTNGAADDFETRLELPTDREIGSPLNPATTRCHRAFSRSQNQHPHPASAWSPWPRRHNRSHIVGDFGTRRCGIA